MRGEGEIRMKYFDGEEGCYERTLEDRRVRGSFVGVVLRAMPSPEMWRKPGRYR
jgi:hypothetical protein